MGWLVEDETLPTPLQLACMSAYTTQAPVKCWKLPGWQVVPTIYTTRSNRTISTNQYSVTEHFKPSNVMAGHNLPGVFFFYDLSPIKVGHFAACPRLHIDQMCLHSGCGTILQHRTQRPCSWHLFPRHPHNPCLHSLGIQ